MKNKEKILIEVCVDSFESALIAEAGNADRIELCSDLMCGGLTPSIGLIEQVKDKISIPIHIMIRPRRCDFCYCEYEIETMKRDINHAKDIGVDGVVFGVLEPTGKINFEVTKELITYSRPLSVTFHRAIDMTNDIYLAVENLVKLGCDRILTSGQNNTAKEGIEIIKEITDIYGDKIKVMAGAGINKQNAKEIIEKTGIKEIHLSAKESINSKMIFRNEKINMGSKDCEDEYTYFITNKEKIDISFN